MTLRLQSCDAWPSRASRSMASISSACESPITPSPPSSLILIQSLSDVHTDMSTPDDKQLPKSQLSVRVVAVVLGIGLLLSNAGGIEKNHSTALTAPVATALTLALAASLSAAGTCCSSRARSNLLATVTRPAGRAGRVAPTFATGDRSPAVRLVRIEIFNRW